MVARCVSEGMLGSINQRYAGQRCKVITTLANSSRRTSTAGIPSHTQRAAISLHSCFVSCKAAIQAMLRVRIHSLAYRACMNLNMRYFTFRLPTNERNFFSFALTVFFGP